MKTEDEVIDEKLDIGFEYDNEYHIEEIRTKPSGDIYRLINLKKDIYEYQFRLKAFLTDFGRVKIAKIALLNIDNVVRIQTDSITYNEPIILTINNFVIDDFGGEIVKKINHCCPLKKILLLLLSIWLLNLRRLCVNETVVSCREKLLYKCG